LKSNSLSQIITSFTLYKFLDALTTPFIRTAAYKRGIIDQNGNQIKPDEQLSQGDLAVFTSFDRLVFSIKRLIAMVPDPYVRANMTNITSALNLISEECERLGGEKEEFTRLALREMVACRLVEEGEGAGPGMAMGGSFSTTNVNTLDNPQGNIAGYDPVLATGKKIFRRKKPNKYFTDKNNSY
jgi:hypothetical protein